MTIVVTKYGWGPVWRFSGAIEASVHPDVQDGDAVIHSKEDIVEQYNALEFPRLLRMLRIEGASAIEMALRRLPPRRKLELMRDNAARVMVALCQVAVDPPHNPDKERLMVEKVKKVAEEKAAAKTPKETVAKEPKAPAGPRAPKGCALTDIITFGKDKAGKEYGPENNPKRPSSQSHARFALYKSGMTVKDALGAGVSTADIAWDVSHNLIVVTADPKAPAATAPVAEAA